MSLIRYEAHNFPASTPIQNGQGVLSCSWGDLIWASLTLGRQSMLGSLAHYVKSPWEAIFRISLVRTLLGSPGPQLPWKRSIAASSLDPSEKAATNYFLGLILTKLFASRFLSTPWLLHLDSVDSSLVTILKGRSRPDLIGLSVASEWFVFECKGRGTAPAAKAVSKAKHQAGRVSAIGGQAPSASIAAFSYFRVDELQFEWHDPPQRKRRRSFEVPFDPDMWRAYFAPLAQLLMTRPETTRARQEPTAVYVPEVDVYIEVVPAVLRRLLDEDWDGARRAAMLQGPIDERYHLDGISVIAGSTWD